MLLERGDLTTGEYKIYSSATGELVFKTNDYCEQNMDFYTKITVSIRFAEKIARKQAFLDMEKMIEKTRIEKRGCYETKRDIFRV